ncbi:MAG: glutaredoxin family protein [Ramlibacter sp.]|nr:glutaredoxin family protein [Ramlibacter sp.]
MPLVRPFLAIALCGIAAAASFALPAQAQQVFRIVGPDGKVTFSDKPPLESNSKVAPIVRMPAGGGAAGGLPFELQQTTSKYPVTLYTGSDCTPCATGRAYLNSRGIPFTERTVTSAEDVVALQRLAGEKSIPMLAVGGQQIRGFSSSEWSLFLDAAGYPAKSMLPAAWRNPPPSSLVALQRPPAAATAAQPENEPVVRRAPESSPPASSSDNPAGIKF